MKTVLTAYVIVILFAVTSFGLTKEPAQPTIKTYGNAVVAKIVGVDNAYIIRCNIKGFPAVIGEDIAVRINGITEPKIVSEGGTPNRFFQKKAKKFLAAHLSNSKTIKIENIKRGNDFSLIADVVTDSNSLADILIKYEFARKLTEEEIILLTRTTKQKPETQAQGRLSGNQNEQRPNISRTSAGHYVASKSSKVFHEPTCRFAKSMDEKKALKFSSKQQATSSGRRACKICGK